MILCWRGKVDLWYSIFRQGVDIDKFDVRGSRL